MVTIKTGNLLQAEETLIGHQVNCFGAAGGLAAAVFKKWPQAGRDYEQLVERVQNIYKTSHHQISGIKSTLLGFMQPTGELPDGHIIANLYGQFHPGADYRPKALEEALELLGDFARVTGKSVALPYKISCGICGGDWDEVQQIIERTMVGVNCVIYKRAQDK